MFIIIIIIAASALLFIVAKKSTSEPSNYERNLAEIKATHSADEILRIKSAQAQEIPQPNTSYDPDAPYTPLPEIQTLALVENAEPVDLDLEPWTSAGSTINRGHNIEVVIKYKSETGDVTVRKVRIAELQGTIHKDFSVTLISVTGFCYLRNEDRTFYFSGIKAAGDPHRGVLITHFPRFIMRRFGRSNPIRMRNKRLM